MPFTIDTGEVLAVKYRLTRRLGKGGEGSVYLAVHLQTEMFWAIKEIPWKEEETDGAVCHELQMMKQLKNRHLPQIIDVLRQGESVFLVMEHVRGIPMDRRLKRDQVLSFREVRDVAEQVTETLCYLESRPRPVCHLDIKPSNLILQPDGLIRLVDFGSAWKEKEQRKRTGTDGYAAPEQYREDSPEPDVRTDIYGLGATLYRMVTGRIWSEASREEGIPDCPAEWSGLMLKCLREDPDQRYQSAALLRDAMGRLRKKEKRERGRRQFLAALAMAFPSAALCISILPSTIDLSADESWNYEKLISEAAVVSAEESYSFYRRAVFLEPDRSDAYLHFLSDAQMDGDLSEEEEIRQRLRLPWPTGTAVRGRTAGESLLDGLTRRWRPVRTLKKTAGMICPEEEMIPAGRRRRNRKGKRSCTAPLGRLWKRYGLRRRMGDLQALWNTGRI